MFNVANKDKYGENDLQLLEYIGRYN